jgi:spore coat polysaccharide biosynthesis protein SpsF
MRFDALERAWREDDNLAWREHVTPYIRRHPELFESYGVLNDEDLSHMRWTVDTPEDLDLVRRIHEHFGHDQFSWREVIALLERYPAWLRINREIEQKKI